MPIAAILLTAVFALLGLPLLLGWLRGEFVIFWTREGAALVQCYGIAAAVLFIGWLSSRSAM